MSKTALGIGFGKILNEEIRKRNGANKKPPTMFEVLANPISSQSLAKADWLKLGDEVGADIAGQIQAQQSNVALLSALLLTIQFAFLYAFPGSWNDLITNSYLASHMDDGQLQVLHEVFLISCLTSVVLNCMCMIFCVVVVLALGEVSAGSEVTFLSLRLGLSISGSMPMFLLSIAIWALKTFLFQIFASASVTGVVLNMVLSMIIVVWLMTAFYGRLIQTLFEVKYVEALPNPSKTPNPLRPLLASPLYENKAQIDDWVEQFGRECGIHLISEEIFLIYVTYAARGKVKRELGPELTEMELAVVDSLDLCELTRTLCKKAAAAKLDELVEAEEASVRPKAAAPPAPPAQIHNGNLAPPPSGAQLAYHSLSSKA